MGAASRLYYRLIKAGINLLANGDRLAAKAAQPLTDEQRQAVRDHKPDLLDLAHWYADDRVIIEVLTEDQFVALAEDYLIGRAHDRGSMEKSS